MSCDPPQWFEQVVASARLRPYRDAAHADGTHTEILYLWNLDVSSAFYRPLSFLEVGLRNALHDQLRLRYGSPDWWDAAPLGALEKSKVRQAADDLRQRKPARRYCADGIVAGLSFGFWVSLLTRRYHQTLWAPSCTRRSPLSRGSRDPPRQPSGNGQAAQPDHASRAGTSPAPGGGSREDLPADRLHRA